MSRTSVSDDLHHMARSLEVIEDLIRDYGQPDKLATALTRFEAELNAQIEACTCEACGLRKDECDCDGGETDDEEDDE